MQNRLLLSLFWAFAGSLGLEIRQTFAKNVAKLLPSIVLDSNLSLIDVEVGVKSNGAFTSWQQRVPQLHLDETQAASPDIMIPTTDTIRHTEIIRMHILSCIL